MNKSFFSQPWHYKLPTENPESFDVVPDHQCSKLRKGEGLCEDCYKEALTKKIRSLSVNKVSDFLNYQINRYEIPIQFLKDLQDYWLEVDYDKEGINSNVYSMVNQFIIAGIKQLSEPKTEEPIKQKVIWQRDPDLFFILFSSLYEEGFFNIKQGSNDLKHVAETLYKTFHLNTKIGDREEYSFSSFHQNLKPTGSRLSEVIENVNLKKRVSEFLKSFPQ